MTCLSSSIWVKMPGFIEGCLESCSISSQKQVASVVGLSPIDSPEVNSAPWPMTSAFIFWSWPLVLTGVGCQGFQRPGVNTWGYSGSLRPPSPTIPPHGL